MRSDGTVLDRATRERVSKRLRVRRDRLTAVVAEVGTAEDLTRLLREVDRALDRLDTDQFGQCELCDGTVDDTDLLARPQLPYCLCDLTPEQQETLQRDLDLAWRVQAAVLPEQDLTFGGWTVHYRYRPAGPVGGDYCDVVVRDDDGYVLLGDVCGKGVAASFVMAQLNALVRSAAPDDPPVAALVERVDRRLGQSTLPDQFVTLVCGRFASSGTIHLCNAGHCPPIVVRRAGVETIPSNGMPLGLHERERHGVRSLTLDPGDSLVLYTDGVTETRAPDGRLYGATALGHVAAAQRDASPARMADACIRELSAFSDGAPPADDLTIMVVRRL